MKRLPFVLAIVLFLLWLLLNNTLAPGHIVLGALFAVALTLSVSSVRPLQPRMRRPARLVGLIFTVLIEIVRSNIGVARVILGLIRDREVKSGFIDIPLDMRDPHGLAVLAMIVTSTPGTVWAGLAPDGARLTLHVLDLRDGEAWIRLIKGRYERPLMEIFE